MSCIFIGVSGGTGSGKTSICEIVEKNFNTTVISQDSFYNSVGLEKAEKHDFDHPNAIDWDRFYECIEELSLGKSTTKPIYNFSTHSREGEEPIEKAQVYIIEGILLFYDERIRNLLDIKVFVEAPSDTRLIRRIRRDLVERGRDLEGVLKQYETFVIPGYENFTLPTKRYANIIVPNGADGINQIAVDMLISTIKNKIE